MTTIMTLQFILGPEPIKKEKPKNIKSWGKKKGKNPQAVPSTK